MLLLLNLFPSVQSWSARALVCLLYLRLKFHKLFVLRVVLESKSCSLFIKCSRESNIYQKISYSLDDPGCLVNNVVWNPYKVQFSS